MQFIASFFGFSGRMGRMAFLVRQLLLLALMFVAGALMITGSLAVTEVWLWVSVGGFLLLLPFLVAANLSLLARRLHDMDLSAWHMVWIIVIKVSAQTLDRAFGGEDPLVLTLDVVALLTMLWLLLMPGTRGENRFGQRT